MAKILIVDDESLVVDMVQMQLEANGYEVISANNGEEGLEKAKTENPDLIVLDIMMPGVDGLEVCRTLKNDAPYSKIPIIFLSAKAQADDFKAGKEVMADAYITKPFEAPVLIARIEELLSQKEEDSESFPTT